MQLELLRMFRKARLLLRMLGWSTAAKQLLRLLRLFSDSSHILAWRKRRWPNQIDLWIRLYDRWNRLHCRSDQSAHPCLHSEHESEIDFDSRTFPWIESTLHASPHLGIDSHILGIRAIHRHLEIHEHERTESSRFQVPQPWIPLCSWTSAHPWNAFFAIAWIHAIQAIHRISESRCHASDSTIVYSVSRREYLAANDDLLPHERPRPAEPLLSPLNHGSHGVSLSAQVRFVSAEAQLFVSRMYTWTRCRFRTQFQHSIRRNRLFE